MGSQTTREETSPRIEIQPLRALVDEPVSIKLFGFGAEQPVTLRAHARTADGYVWQSSATFLTNAQGGIDFGTQTPLTGTYTQADTRWASFGRWRSWLRGSSRSCHRSHPCHLLCTYSLMQKSLVPASRRLRSSGGLWVQR